MTITDTDAPVSIWALLSVLVTAMGVPGGDSSRHRPVGLWGWEGAMTDWACKSRSRLRGCPCSLPSSTLFIRIFSCLPSPFSSLCPPLPTYCSSLCNIPALLPVWRLGMRERGRSNSFLSKALHPSCPLLLSVSSCLTLPQLFPF